MSQIIIYVLLIKNITFNSKYFIIIIQLIII